MRSRPVAGVLAALVVALLCGSPADARGLTLGFMDFAPFEGPDNAAWYERARASGAGIVRLTANWSTIAPSSRSALADARDPADPGYRWTRLDTAVRGASDHGIEALVTALYAPRWAEGPDRPPGVRPGTWKPDPEAFADFMHAAARRYDGTFADPIRPGAILPRVRFWQPWNEPNLATYLTPQWSRSGPLVSSASPARYRRMLNAAYARIKAVRADNTVVAAGTAPYGDPPQAENRMTPVRFLRELFCFRNARLTRASCGTRPRLDAIDHHPYATGTPTDRAMLRENVAIPDLHKLVRVLDKARREKTVMPAGAKRVWVTEVSWDSSPPDPDGVPERRRARWLQDTFYSLWSQGASTICWFLLRDMPPTPSYDTTYQSGLYLVNGSAKLSARAFRFPLVARRSNGRTAVWGKSPLAGTVVVERRRGDDWRTVGTLRVRASGIFRGRVLAPKRAILRARAGAEASLSRRVR